MIQNKKTLRVLSLGAGVQSTTLALMINQGELPMVNCAIFADTKGEPKYVYDHLNWLKNKLKFPIYIVTNGNLLKDNLKLLQGKHTSKGALIPYHMLYENKKSIGFRQCTTNYKIRPIQKKVRELLGLKKYQRAKNMEVKMIIGISYDELNRMTINKTKYIENLYPFVEKKITRQQCIKWLKNNNYPIPNRSACWFCPYHTSKEWIEMKNNHTEELNKAVKFEKIINRENKVLKGKLFLNGLHKNLEDLKPKNNNQLEFSFKDECEGMCGV